MNYQPTARFLFGFRALFNQNTENRIDNTTSVCGFAGSQEYRLGASAGLWKGALIDIGANFRAKQNDIAGISSSQVKPNIGLSKIYGTSFSIKSRS